MAGQVRLSKRKSGPFDLSGKIAVVTGSGRGMGAAIASCLAANGATVVVANRTVNLAEQVAASIVSEGGRAVALPYDGSSRESNEELIEIAARKLGGIDILVHNAASITRSPLEEMEDILLDQALDVNLKACFWLARACIPSMRQRRGGRIVVTSSVTGPRVAAYGLSHYAASKAGVNGFIRSAALELSRDAITVNGIEPGYIAQPEKGRTGDDAESREVARFIPAGRIGTPQDVAFAALYLVSCEAAFVTGQTIVVDGGAMLPESPLAIGPGDRQ